MTFSSVFLPYCLDRQLDGRYVVLNRRYKPIGFTAAEWVEYADYPVLISFENLDSDTVTRLSVDASGELDRIYLYNDATNPKTSDANMRAYLERLAILGRLRVL